MSQDAQKRDRLKASIQRFKCKAVSVGPGELVRVAVGSYPQSDEDPTFSIKSFPDIHEQLTYALEKIYIPGGGRYMLFYHLQNFSDKSCQVTIAARSRGRGKSS